MGKDKPNKPSISEFIDKEHKLLLSDIEELFKRLFQERCSKMDTYHSTGESETSSDEPSESFVHNISEYETQIRELNDTVSVIAATINELKSMIDASNSTIATDEAAIKKLEDAIAEKDGIIAVNEATIKKLEDAIAERDGTIAANEATIKELNDTVAKRDGTIAANEATIKELNDTVAKRDGTIAANEATIKVLNDTVAERDSTIAANEATIDELKGTIAERNSTIAANEATIDELKGTIAERDRTIAANEATIDELKGTVAERDLTISQCNAVIASHEKCKAEYEEAIAPFVEMNRLLCKCPSLNTLVDDLAIPCDSELSISDAIVMANIVSDKIYFAGKIYEHLKNFKRDNPDTLSEEELALIAKVNAYYKDVFDIDHDVLDCSILERLKNGDRVRFDMKTMRINNDLQNFDAVYVGDLYVPILRDIDCAMAQYAIVSEA